MAKWFTDSEVAGLQPRLVDMLDKAREFAGVPFLITCGYRSPDHNAAVGGAPNSAHLRGLAVDLRAQDSFTRFHIIRGSIFAGFNRIVVYHADGHVHIDCDPSLPQNVFVVES